MRKIVSSSSDTEQRKRKRKDKKGVQKEATDRDSNNLGFARTNLSERITFGPYKGQTFMEVAKKDINYFFICIYWITEIKLFPDKLGLVIAQTDCDLKEAHNIYNVNIKSYRHFKDWWKPRESGYNIEIIKNIKSEYFDKQLHLSLIEIYNRRFEENLDDDNEKENSGAMRLFLEMMISFFKDDANIINHIEDQLSNKKVVADISDLDITQFEIFELLIQYYRYELKLLEKRNKERNEEGWDGEYHGRCPACEQREPCGCNWANEQYW